MNKVQIISTVHVWNDTRVFYKEARSLQQNGFEVEVNAIADFDMNVVDNIKVIGFKRTRNRFRRIMLIGEVIKRCKRSNANIVHIHDPELLFAAFLVKLVTNKKVIYDVHEDLPADIMSKDWIPLGRRKVVSKIVNFFEKKMANRMDALLFAESYYKENFIRVKRPLKEDILNYPMNSYSINHVQFPKPDGDSIKLIYAGGLSNVRGLFEMVESFIRISNVFPEKKIELYLVGPLSTEDEIRVKQRVEERVELAERLIITGRIPHEEVMRLLSAADIGFAILHPEPNFVKSLATKLFEYMSVGLPYIASNFEYWNTITENEGCGISVDPLDCDKITESLKNLIKEPDLRAKLSENGRRAIVKYQWINEEEKLLNVYGKLLQKK